MKCIKSPSIWMLGLCLVMLRGYIEFFCFIHWRNCSLWLRFVQCQRHYGRLSFFFSGQHKRLIQQLRHNRWQSFRNGMKIKVRL